MVDVHAADPVWKTIEETSVLSVRLVVSGQQEIQKEVTTRRRSLGECLTGPPIARLIGTVERGVEVELAFPVDEGTTAHGLEARRLPRLHALTAFHRGALEAPAGSAGVRDAALAIYGFAGERSLLLGDDPLRYVYHEGPERHGEDESSYVTEVQVPYHFPFWLEGLRAGAETVAGSEEAESIMNGSAGLAERLDGSAAARWVEGAVRRVESMVTSEEARAEVLQGCAHHYLIPSAEHLRLLAEESGTLRALVDRIDRDAVLGGRYAIDETGIEPRLVIKRAPARPDAFAEATDPAEKRYQACFCPLVRDALREGRMLPRAFCHCSAGWYVQEWEPILGVRPRVDLLETMIDGAAACRFAVHLPPGILEARIPVG